MQTCIKWPADIASGQALHACGEVGREAGQQLVVAPGRELVALLGQGLQAALASRLFQRRAQGQSEFGLDLQLALEGGDVVRVAAGKGSGLAACLLRAGELGGWHRRSHS